MAMKNLYTRWKNKTKKGIITVQSKPPPQQEVATETTTNARQRKITVVSLASNQHGLKIDGPNAEIRNQSLSTIRLDKVISEIKDFHYRTENQLKKSVKKQAKELGWFFAIFVIYIMFGTFLFFYIEECSGASTPSDNSVPHFHEGIMIHKDLNTSCNQLYDAFVNEVIATSNYTAFLNSTHHSQVFNMRCHKLFQQSPDSISSMEKKSCDVSEIVLLKYAEFTIFTLLTIGYGNTTPITTVGRMTLVFYAVFGIPLAVTMYSVAGKLIVQLITLIIRMIQTRLLKSKKEITHIQLKTLCVSIFFMLTIMLTGCAVTTSTKMENLSFSSSFYFWFVSLSTIGYGDIHFDRRAHLKNPHLMILSSLNLLFGLGIMAAIIEAFSLALEKKDLQMSTIIIDEDDFNKDEQPESDKSLWMQNYRNHMDEQESETNLTDLSSKDDDAVSLKGRHSHSTVVGSEWNGRINSAHTNDNDDHLTADRLNVFQINP